MQMYSLIENHVYRRNIWLWICFSLGTFNAAYYYGESIYKTSFTLCLLPPLFMTYLAWDAYKLQSYKQLYRSDLLAHHMICLIVYSYMSVYGTYYTASLFVIAENLSLFNCLLNHLSLLKYKLFILLCYRIPFWLIFISSSLGDIEYADHNYIIMMGPPLFICYDLFMLKKIIQKLYK